MYSHTYTYNMSGDMAGVHNPRTTDKTPTAGLGMSWKPDYHKVTRHSIQQKSQYTYSVCIDICGPTAGYSLTSTLLHTPAYIQAGSKLSVYRGTHVSVQLHHSFTNGDELVTELPLLAQGRNSTCSMSTDIHHI